MPDGALQHMPLSLDMLRAYCIGDKTASQWNNDNTKNNAIVHAEEMDPGQKVKFDRLRTLRTSAPAALKLKQLFFRAVVTVRLGLLATTAGIV